RKKGGLERLRNASKIAGFLVGVLTAPRSTSVVSDRQHRRQAQLLQPFCLFSERWLLRAVGSWISRRPPQQSRPHLAGPYERQRPSLALRTSRLPPRQRR